MVDDDLGYALKSIQENQKNEAIEWKNKGNDCFKKGDYETAIHHYKNALDLDPNYSNAWNNLGLTYIRTGKIEEAKKCYEKMSLPQKKQKAQPNPIFKTELDKRPFWLGIFGFAIGFLVSLIGFMLTVLSSLVTVIGHDKSTGFNSTIILFGLTIATVIFSIIGMISGIYGHNKRWGILMAFCGIIVLFTTYFVGILATIFFAIGGIILYNNSEK